MPIKVVDASALAAVLFGEAEGDEITARLRGGSLVATAILPFELANTCLKKIRRSPAQREALLTGLAMYEDFAIEIVEIDRLEMLTSAELSGLTVYDASYLHLAQRLAAELVTLDRRLDAASKGLPRR